MARASNRRGFFKELLRGAAEETRSLGLLGEPQTTATRPAAPAPPPAAGPRRRARAASACLTVDELLALARSAGLAERDAELRALARRSVRLTPDADADDVSRSRLGGSPDLPGSWTWPQDWLPDLRFVAQIDLAALARAGLADELPDRGLLALYYDEAGAPPGARFDHRGAGRAVWIDDAAGELAGGDGGRPLAASAELVLPSAWSAALAPLDLSWEEQSAWEELRERLADAQGVEPDEPGATPLALHRLLGHPDDPRGTMPLVCELLADGIPAPESPEPGAAGELAQRARRWRLLVQLTPDRELLRTWPEDRARLCFWIDAEALGARSFASVYALGQ